MSAEARFSARQLQRFAQISHPNISLIEPADLEYARLLAPSVATANDVYDYHLEWLTKRSFRSFLKKWREKYSWITVPQHPQSSLSKLSLSKL
jgi:hypothetical protein